MGAEIPEDNTKIPEQLRYLYDLFMGLRFDRIPSDDGFKLMAKSGLSYSDVYYHSIMTGLELYKWELDCVMSINAVFDKYSG